MLKRKLWILTFIVATVGILGLLFDKTPAESDDFSSAKSSASSSSEYDAFSNPDVLWGSEKTFFWEFEHPPRSIVVSLGLKDLISKANEPNQIRIEGVMRMK